MPLFKPRAAAVNCKRRDAAPVPDVRGASAPGPEQRLVGFSGMFGGALRSYVVFVPRVIVKQLFPEFPGWRCRSRDRSSLRARQNDGASGGERNAGKRFMWNECACRSRRPRRLHFGRRLCNARRAGEWRRRDRLMVRTSAARAACTAPKPPGGRTIGVLLWPQASRHLRKLRHLDTMRVAEVGTDDEA